VNEVISIVVITLNERETLAATIAAIHAAARLPSGRTVPTEIIVSDGGSTDGTVEIARALADVTISSPKGRAKQMNWGAMAARGDVLMFMHADTILAEHSLHRINHALRSEAAIGGTFSKEWSWKPPARPSRIVDFLRYEWTGFGNWVVRLDRTFPGDNTVFIRASVFQALGGFAPMWICEDLDFSHRMGQYARKNGFERPVVIRVPVKTSTRRFEQEGTVRTILWWTTMIFGWKLGMSQGYLAWLTNTLFKKQKKHEKGTSNGSGKK
jgi:glycosyltransferase involved in cell wall biosynthesis